MTIDDRGAVDLLSDMLGTSSLTGQEHQLASLLVETWQQAGLSARIDEAGNVLGSVGPSDAPHSLVILGHMDTVPGTIPVVECDGRLYGRGAVDAKGPLAAGIVAAIRAAATTRLQVTVIGAVQEEGPSVGARYLIDHLPAPDYLIIAEPSSWDALVMGYKGSQRFTVTLTVPSSHTAGPEPPAPQRLIKFWNRLVALGETRNVDIRGEFDKLTATLIAMSSTTDGLHESATLTIGLRLPLGITPVEIQANVAALLPEGCFQFQPGEPAVRGEKTNPLVTTFLRSVRAEDGTPRFKVKTGTSDMNLVGPAWGCPMLAYGAGDSRLDHTPEEHVVVDEYLKAIRVLTRVLEELT